MNSIAVKEFDNLNEEMLKNAIPDYNDEFNQLVQFIEENEASQDREDVYRFMSVKQNRELGRHISFKNYVGLIQLKSGFQIEILPKIEFLSTVEETKRVFLSMLKTLRDFEGMTFNISNLNTDRMNLYEVFINLYLQETSKLLKSGLKSSYVSQEDNLCVLKGKLLLKEHIKKNIVHKEKFYVSYDEYSLNRPENKLIKSTLLKLHGLSQNHQNKKLCNQLLAHFEMIEESKNHDADFAKIAYDRSTKDYGIILSWSKVFLKNKSFTTFSGNTLAKALLFPMEKIFESYVAKHLKRTLEELNWLVTAQDKGYYLFDEPQKFKLRPDIVVIRDDKSKIILDTKWKSLRDNPKDNYGISQADMYQMYAYAKKYRTSEIWLIYPLNKEMEGHETISFESKDDLGEQEAFIRLFFVNVANIDKSMQELKALLIR